MSANLIDRFVKDEPHPPKPKAERRNLIENPIHGVSAFRLTENRDDRGFLIELITARDGLPEPVVHVYQVWAEAGSVRGWIYHARHSDRLAYTDGSFKVTLFDLREDSPTYGRSNQLVVGAGNRLMLTIPPFVAHFVTNIGDRRATFVNMPTRPFYPDDPDKHRLAPESELAVALGLPELSPGL